MHSVWIHGSFSSSRFWSAWSDRVGTAIDLPGSLGQPTVRRGDPWQLDDDIDRVRSAWKGGDLVGHSYGGLVAMRSGLVLPNVRQVVVHEPVCWPVLFQQGSPIDRAMLGGDDFLAPFLDEEIGGTEPWVERFVDYWMGAGTYRALPNRMQQAVLSGGWKSFLEVRQAFKDPTPMATWERYPVPVRITVGADAQPAQRRTLELWAELLPDAELVTVPGGHAAPRTHPAELAAVWGPWLDQA